MSRRVDVARAALLEVGREDLAKLIGESRIGDPKCVGGIIREDRPRADSVLIMAAMRLGHMSDSDGAPVECLLVGDGDEATAFPACHGCLGECMTEAHRWLPEDGDR